MAVDPFEESRRLTGCNVYFAGTGAALEAARGLSFDEAAVARWRANVRDARAWLGWPDGEIVGQHHRSGVSLAFAAPMDRLYAATALNEWAWCDALGLRAARDAGVDDGSGLLPAPVASLPRDAALGTLRALADAEAKPALLALQCAADAHGVPLLADDAVVSIGAGAHGRAWAIDALPAPGAVPWHELRAIPTVLVTGSNGKTTTVRLLAAMCRAHGWPTAHSCTDGVFLDGVALEAGDFSGPQGARTVLRQPRAEAAILETARGGLLRRGLALCQADVAVVTNVGADHFGEYGVHDLDDLARVKLTVARAVADGGLLVLNADDEVLRRHAPRFAGQRLGWFSCVDEAPALIAHREAGGATCALGEGHLRLYLEGRMFDLGTMAGMPLSLGGNAAYNVSNLAAAALAAAALGIAPETIAAVLRRFGAARTDNPGRLQRWHVGGVDVVVDYAHNPDGLRGLLQAVGAGRHGGRLAITVGHAGNREESDLRAVAAMVAAFSPELVVLKSAEGYLRGRAAGEIPAIMRDELLRRGMAASCVATEPDEVAAARRALAWAGPGDLVVLPTFEHDARVRIEGMLARMESEGWNAGAALPAPDPQ